MNRLFVHLAITVLLIIIILLCYFTKVDSKEEHFTSSKQEVNIFSLKEHKKKFLDSVANLNKQIQHLKEYYKNEDDDTIVDL